MRVFVKNHIVTVVIILGMLSACSSNQILPDYETDTDFKRYNSYRWRAELPEKSIHVKNPFTHTAILQQVDNILKTSNLKKVQNKKPVDLIIDYQMSIEGRQSRSNSSISFGSGTYGRGSSVGIGVAIPLGGVKTENEVTFIISITDYKNNKIVWRAVATETITANPASITFKNRLLEMAKNIINQYPPKK